MRLKLTESKNATSLYVIKSVTVNGKRTTKIVEKLGTFAALQKKLDGGDPITWAKKYIEELNEKEAEEAQDVLVKFSSSKLIPEGAQRKYNGGYLFLQKVYHELGIDRICANIAARHSFDFNLDAVLSRLLYGRILFPASKLATMELSQRFIEGPDFKLQHLYRALEVLASESDFIQSSLFNNSRKVIERRTGVIFYDCTNYFFEIEQEDGDRRYGFSKEHRPNPIVQMGLFMDSDGIPISFCMNPGNTNEQVTLAPLEQKLLSPEFGLSKFVVCTDAGLSSVDNRKFNDVEDRAFVTTQSVKKLKKYLMDWALASTGWRTAGSDYVYDLNDLDEQIKLLEVDDYDATSRVKDRVFYKERWVKEDGLDQRLIVTFSFKYRNYQRTVRNAQIERAIKVMECNPTKLKKCNANDYKRFIHREAHTKDGKKAAGEVYSLDIEQIAKEEKFDGFYAVCTDLEDNVAAILKIVHDRWEIEECFRIMKSEFKARPVFLSRDDRIRAHFLTCFISLLIYRVLERKLDNYIEEQKLAEQKKVVKNDAGGVNKDEGKGLEEQDGDAQFHKAHFTCSEIINGLRGMEFAEVPGEGYVPLYTRTDFTNTLHEAFGFRTDYQIVNTKKMKSILRQTRQANKPKEKKTSTQNKIPNNK